MTKHKKLKIRLVTTNTQSPEVIIAFLNLVFAVAVADKKLRKEEVLMITDLVSVNVRRIFHRNHPSRDLIERTLGAYELKVSKNWGKNNGGFPYNILDEYTDQINENQIRSIVLRQLLAVALSDNEIHNNELAILNYISEKWGMQEEYKQFQTAIIKALTGSGLKHI